ncbi:L-rhamnose operon transcriptional activator rhaR [Chlamydia abortus]|nr:L-rhamnose operon transcriptional activator rhaR [Chlamydia abortus]
MIPPNTLFATEWTAGLQCSMHYFSVGISAFCHGMEWSELYGIPRHCRPPGQETASLCTVWRRLIQAWEQAPRSLSTSATGALSAETASRHLYAEALSKLWLAEATKVLQPFMATPEPLIDERVRRVCFYIRSAYMNPIRLTDMAKLVNISEGHLRLLFRRELSQSPYQYLLLVRIEKAKELLLYTELLLTEISYRVGFDEYGHFMSTFRKLVGLSPSKYRKANNPYS